MNGTIRQVCRNVKRWQDAKMALRWTAAGMLEAAKGFRRLKAYRQLPAFGEPWQTPSRRTCDPRVALPDLPCPSHLRTVRGPPERCPDGRFPLGAKGRNRYRDSPLRGVPR